MSAPAAAVSRDEAPRPGVRADQHAGADAVHGEDPDAAPGRAQPSTAPGMTSRLWYAPRTSPDLSTTTTLLRSASLPASRVGMPTNRQTSSSRASRASAATLEDPRPSIQRSPILLRNS